MLLPHGAALTAASTPNNALTAVNSSATVHSLCCARGVNGTLCRPYFGNPSQPSCLCHSVHQVSRNPTVPSRRWGQMRHTDMALASGAHGAWRGCLQWAIGAGIPAGRLSSKGQRTGGLACRRDGVWSLQSLRGPRWALTPKLPLATRRRREYQKQGVGCSTALGGGGQEVRRGVNGRRGSTLELSLPSLGRRESRWPKSQDISPGSPFASGHTGREVPLVHAGCVGPSFVQTLIIPYQPPRLQTPKCSPHPSSFCPEALSYSPSSARSSFQLQQQTQG